MTTDRYPEEANLDLYLDETSDTSAHVVTDDLLLSTDFDDLYSDTETDQFFTIELGE